MREEKKCANGLGDMVELYLKLYDVKALYDCNVFGNLVKQ
jgi:hypothetical protein